MPNSSNRNGLNIRLDIKKVVDQSPTVDTTMEDYLLPAIPVSQVGGKIQLTTAHAGSEVTDNRRSKEGSFVKGSFRYTDDTFFTEISGNEAELDNVQTLEIKNAYNFDEEVFAGKLAVNWMKTARKVKVKEAIFDNTDWAGEGHRIVPSTKWDANPLAALEDVRKVKDLFKERHGVLGANLHLGITEEDFDAFIMSLVEQDTLKYNESILTKSYDEQRNIVRQFLKIKQVAILDGMVSTAKDFFEEQADFTSVYDPGKCLFFLPSAGGTSWASPGLGRQPIYTPYSSSYRVDTYDKKSTMKRIVRATEYRGVKVNPAYGVLIENPWTV